MKRRLRGTLFFIMLMGLLSVCALPAAAAGFKTVPTATSWPDKQRTVKGAVFSSTSVYSSYYKAVVSTLRVKKNGTTKQIGTFRGGNFGNVISDGATVYLQCDKLR